MGLEDAFQLVEWTEGARNINDCEYLFIEEIGETEELTLNLLITEAKAQAPILRPKDDSVLERLKVGSRPIQPDSTCRFFQIVFDRRHMVAYMVSNESYGRYPEAPEEFIGKLFRIFTKSHLLDFTKRTSYASDVHPGKLHHYRIVCSNHVVDVIATGPPTISVSSARRFAAHQLAQLGGTQPDAQDIPRRRSQM